MWHLDTHTAEPQGIALGIKAQVQDIFDMRPQYSGNRAIRPMQLVNVNIIVFRRSLPLMFYALQIAHSNL